MKCDVNSFPISFAGNGGTGGRSGESKYDNIGGSGQGDSYTQCLELATHHNLSSGDGGSGQQCFLIYGGSGGGVLVDGKGPHAGNGTVLYITELHTVLILINDWMNTVQDISRMHLTRRLCFNRQCVGCVGSIYSVRRRGVWRRRRGRRLRGRKQARVWLAFCRRQRRQRIRVRRVGLNIASRASLHSNS